MQAIRPNSRLKYQSLDMPFHFSLNCLPDRKFKYNHIMRLKDKQLTLKIGDRIEQSSEFFKMSIRGDKRDGFFRANLILPNISKYIRFPLYKTVEEYNFIEINYKNM
jgi:hypothetical protein